MCVGVGIGGVVVCVGGRVSGERVGGGGGLGKRVRGGVSCVIVIIVPRCT